jgi:hypothetical protein
MNFLNLSIEPPTLKCPYLLKYTNKNSLST